MRYCNSHHDSTQTWGHKVSNNPDPKIHIEGFSQIIYIQTLFNSFGDFCCLSVCVCFVFSEMFFENAIRKLIITTDNLTLKLQKQVLKIILHVCLTTIKLRIFEISKKIVLFHSIFFFIVYFKLQ